MLRRPGIEFGVRGKTGKVRAPARGIVPAAQLIQGMAFEQGGVGLGGAESGDM